MSDIPHNHPYHEVWKEVLHLRAEVDRLRASNLRLETALKEAIDAFVELHKPRGQA